jgi:hypothetical protein
MDGCQSIRRPRGESISARNLNLPADPPNALPGQADLADKGYFFLQSTTAKSWPAKKSLYAFCQSDQIAKLTLPKHQYAPSSLPQPPPISAITSYGAFKFLFPGRDIPARHRTSLTPPMSVPETAVDEDDFPRANKDYVWASRQVTTVKSIPNPQTGENMPNDQFGRRVSGRNPTHSI